MTQNLDRSDFNITYFLQGLGFLALGSLSIFSVREIKFQCLRVGDIQNQCQLISYRLIGSRTVQEISNVEMAVLEQQTYESHPGKKSIVDSRIAIIAAGKRILLNDDRTSKSDQKIVEQINSFVQNTNQKSMQVTISQFLQYDFIAIISGLAGYILLKKSNLKP